MASAAEVVDLTGNKQHDDVSDNGPPSESPQVDVETSDKQHNNVSDNGTPSENTDASPTKADIMSRIIATGGVRVSMLSLCL